jgi:AcrR family transcriptional regulator
MAMTQDSAPAGAAAGQSIWDLPERGARGPKARHDRAAIAAIAVRIADADGIDAVTMRRVAADLGIATMSLYTYVPTKDHLAQLMIDWVAGEYVYAAIDPGADPRAAASGMARDPRAASGLASDPRAAVADLARQARDAARRHPWLAGLLQRPAAPGPNGLRYLDYFLGLLTTSALDTGGKLEVIAMISGFATMYGGLQAAAAAGSGGDDPGQAAAQVQAFTRAAASGRYPHLATALAAAGPVRDEEDVFGSCIGRLIEVAFPRG